MRNAISEVVFKEPEGRNSGLIQVGIAVVLLLVYVYMGRRYGFGLNPSIVLAVVFSLYGVAEMLPTKRRQLAGSVRLAAIILGVSLVIIS